MPLALPKVPQAFFSLGGLGDQRLKRGDRGLEMIPLAAFIRSIDPEPLAFDEKRLIFPVSFVGATA